MQLVVREEDYSYRRKLSILGTQQEIEQIEHIFYRHLELAL